MNHLAHIFIMFLVTMAYCSTLWEGMIFERLGDMIEENLGEKWAKPLGKCYICTSFWVAMIITLFMWWPWWYPFATLGMAAAYSKLTND